MLITALEGAFVLSRSLRSTEPLEVAGAAVTEAVRAALPRPNCPAAEKGSPDSSA